MRSSFTQLEESHASPSVHVRGSMKVPIIHPNWSRPPAGMVDGFSLEMTAKDREALRQTAPAIPPETPIAITFLPGEDMAERVAAAPEVRALGFEPMPHLSARRI